NPPARSKSIDRTVLSADYKRLLVRISVIVFLTTAVSSIIFQATTFALPKIFDEKLQGLAASFSTWLKSPSSASGPSTATAIGFLAFLVFAVASLTQVAVGLLLDRVGPRKVFLGMAAIQVLFFAMMPGLTDGMALAVAIGFMVGAFGQIPINDYMIGKMASGDFRARVYGVRYVVSFTSLALALPLIGAVYRIWGFDRLFLVLAACAFVILCAVFLLPARLPSPPVVAAPVARS
ncbi:MAG TPA: MFS transporter, partial [Hyphomicrobiaceae bacterium]|nr:MFS transporter [Hyphomicrobiaceae bacterium]